MASGKTKLVRSYLANDYKLYDMAGNVWEWCLDGYDNSYYSKSAKKNPLAGHDSIEMLIGEYKDIRSARVLRGGAWFALYPSHWYEGWNNGVRGGKADPHPHLRAANRFDNSALTARADIGFRCAVDAVSPDSFTSEAGEPFQLAGKEVLDLADTSVALVRVVAVPTQVSASVKPPPK